MMINLRFGTLVLFIGSALVPTLAWTTTSPLMMSALSTNKNNHAGDDGSPSLFSLSTTTTTTTTRRDWMTRVVAIGTTAAVTATTTTSSSSAAWAIDTQTALSELESSMEKMKPIPEYVTHTESIVSSFRRMPHMIFIYLFLVLLTACSKTRNGTRFDRFWNCRRWTNCGI